MTFDAVHTILFILIVLLAGYIIFLHTRLIRKDLIIENIVRKVSGIEKELSMEEIRKVVSELHNFRGKALLLDDKLFDEEVAGFLFSDIKSSVNYIHYTKDEEVALRIMKEGFRFVESFYKTALPLTNDKLDLIIKHNSKKFYGDYIIIICIADEIARYYSARLSEGGIRDLSLENVLTETPPARNENSDNEYILSSHFIKGYVNYRTGEISRNPGFNPQFTSPSFNENISRIKDTAKSS
ncbi:MAG TPA: hypothetical protein VMT63_11050 [Bacteroidales bacterium]|nr:hypothetical protein [Bacteroidales bacterium]